MLPIDSDTLALAGGDGNITIITVQPNTVIGVMGQHDGELPVELGTDQPCERPSSES